MGCPLCKAVNDSYRLIYEDDLIFSIVAKWPLKKGHIMVLPKRHVEELSELTAEESKKIFEIVDSLKETLEKTYGEPAIVNMNCGKNRSQEHIHVHIIPFYGGIRPLISKYEGIPEREEMPLEDMEKMKDEILQNI